VPWELISAMIEKIEGALLLRPTMVAIDWG